jgi:type IV pilus assembly protein PilA
MIVVAIVGVLAGVSLPQYQRAKSTAQATANIAELVAIAKQCAVGMKGSITMIAIEPYNGNQVICNGNSQREINGRAWEGDATGVQCLQSTATSTDTRMKITIATNGGMNCDFL